MHRDSEDGENERERGEETPEQLTPRDIEKERKKPSTADEAESSADSNTLSARLGRYAQTGARRSLASDFNDQAAGGVPLSSSPYGFGTFFPAAVAASPPKFVSVDELMHAVRTIQNMQLAHEIATDTSFRLEKHLASSPSRHSILSGASSNASDSIQSQIERTVKRAFWDALQSKLDLDPPDYSHAIVLLAETKQELLGLMLPHSNALRNEVEQVLDMEFLQQQIEHGALDMAKYADYIIGLMARMCAPARDQQVAAVRVLAARDEPGLSPARKCVEIFKAIFETLEALKLDMANFTIAQMRPVIQQHSVEYEQAQFAKLLEDQRKHGVDGLEYTRQWLRGAFDNVRESLTDVDVATSLVVNEAFVTLLDDTCAMRIGTASPKATSGDASASQAAQLPPETLLLDGTRIDALRDRIDGCVLVSATLLTVGASVPQANGDTELRTSLKRQLLILLGCDEDTSPTPTDMAKFLEGIAERVTNETREHYTRRGCPLTEEQLRALEGQLGDLFRKHESAQKHPVRSLLKRRLLDFVRCVLAAKYKTPTPPSAASWLQSNVASSSQNPQTTAGVGASSNTSAQSLRFTAQIRVPAGLGVVEAELAAACSQLLRLIDYNRRVFGQYYLELVTQMFETRQQTN